MRRLQTYVTDNEYEVIARHADNKSYSQVGDFIKHCVFCFIRRYPECDFDREIGLHLERIGKD